MKLEQFHGLCKDAAVSAVSQHLTPALLSAADSRVSF